MQQAVLNRAATRVADTTEVSGRVTADEVQPTAAATLPQRRFSLGGAGVKASIDRRE